MEKELLSALRKLVVWAKRADLRIYGEWAGPGEKYTLAQEITRIEELLGNEGYDA